MRRLGTGDESQHKYRNFLAGVVDAFGSCFDWASCVVCETSIMFDVLAGIQFYRDGHTAWAWIVFGLLCNSSVVFAVIQTNVFKNQWAWRCCSRLSNVPVVLLFLMVLPLALLCPAFYWVMQRKYTQVGVSEHRWADSYECSAAQSRVAREETRDAWHSAFLMSRLSAGLKWRVDTQAFLLTEAATEAVPQLVVQWLFVSSVEEKPTPLQLTALALSLSVVLSKLSFLCLSFCLRMFAVKLILIAHDVFSLFYVIATVVSFNDANRTDTLFGIAALKVTPLAHFWFIKLLVSAIVAAITLIAAAFLRLRQNTGKRDFWLLFSIGVLLYVLFVVALECFKLTLLLFLLWRLEPSNRGNPAAAMLFSFLEHGSGMLRCGASKWRGKVFHLYAEITERRAVTTGREAALQYFLQTHAGDAGDFQKGDCLQSLVIEAKESAFSHRNLAKFFWGYNRPLQVNTQPLLNYLGHAAMAFAGVSASLSFVFPFLNFAIYRDSQSTLQVVCFAFAVASVFRDLLIYASHRSLCAVLL